MIKVMCNSMAFFISRGVSCEMRFRRTLSEAGKMVAHFKNVTELLLMELKIR